MSCLSKHAQILIANRGEIAVRVMRACRDMGIATVAVYSDADRARAARPLRRRGVPLSAATRAARELPAHRQDHRRRAAGPAPTPCTPATGSSPRTRISPPRAATPGSPSSARRPRPSRCMGSKTAARQTAIDAGVPVVPGTETPLARLDARRRRLPRSRPGIGYPLLVKAVAGGGGKGMRVVVGPGRPAATPCARRAPRPARPSATPPSTSSVASLHARHIEIQLLGDQHGTVVPFVERECSIQRRHQKVVEESPSMACRPALRQRMADGGGRRGPDGRLHQRRHDRVPRRRARRLLLPRDEHAAAGGAPRHGAGDGPRPRPVADPHRARRAARRSTPSRRSRPRGHAIECRIYAEDPDNGFMPSPGRILCLHAPAGPGIRRDSGVEGGFRGADLLRLDGLQARRVGRGPSAGDRAAAARAVGVPGPRHQDDHPVLPVDPRDRDFAEGRFDTTSLDEMLARRKGEPFVEAPDAAEDVAVLAVALRAFLARPQRVGRARDAAGDGRPAGGWRLAARREPCGRYERLRAMTFEIEINGRMRTVRVERAEPAGHHSASRWTARRASSTPWGSRTTRCRSCCPTSATPVTRSASPRAWCRARSPCYLHSGTLTAVVNGRRSRRGAAGGGAGEQRISRRCRARCCACWSAPGDEVAARQPLVVVEAMKMENELSSPRGRPGEGDGRRGGRVGGGRTAARRRGVAPVDPRPRRPHAERTGPQAAPRRRAAPALRRLRVLRATAGLSRPRWSVGVVVALFVIDLGPSLRGLAEREGRGSSSGPCTSAGSPSTCCAAGSSSTTCASRASRPRRRPSSTPGASSSTMPWWTAARPGDLHRVGRADRLDDARRDVPERRATTSSGSPARRAPPGRAGSSPPSSSCAPTRGEFTYQDHGDAVEHRRPQARPDRRQAPRLPRRGAVPRRHRSRSSNSSRCGRTCTARSASTAARWSSTASTSTPTAPTSKVTGVVDMGRWPEQTYDVVSRGPLPADAGDLVCRSSDFSLSGEGEFAGTFKLFKGGRDLTGTFEQPEAGLNASRFPSLRGQAALAARQVRGDRRDLGFLRRRTAASSTHGAARRADSRRWRGFDATLRRASTCARSPTSSSWPACGLPGRASGRNLLEWPLGRFARAPRRGRAAGRAARGHALMTRGRCRQSAAVRRARARGGALQPAAAARAAAQSAATSPTPRAGHDRAGAELGGHAADLRRLRGHDRLRASARASRSTSPAATGRRAIACWGRSSWRSTGVGARRARGRRRHVRRRDDRRVRAPARRRTVLAATACARGT